MTSWNVRNPETKLPAASSRARIVDPRDDDREEEASMRAGDRAGREEAEGEDAPDAIKKRGGDEALNTSIKDVDGRSV
jgi:hypothetical protein